jgi:hypothetical protein
MKKSTQDIKIKKPGIATISRKDIMVTSGEKIRRPTIYTQEKHHTQIDADIVDPKPETRLKSTAYTIRKKPPRIRRSLTIVLVIFLIASGIYVCSTTFQNAQVIINQKHQVFTLTNEQFTASQDQAAPLRFDLMIVSDTQYQDMVLTQSANVSLKAQGTVTVYNQYSSKPITLGAHTYIADSTGKTYLTDKALTVPGFTTDKTTKAITSGTANVTITAFLPGDTYNGSPTDFTITAYKNSTKFTKIYAKAASTLTGGAQGLIYTLTPAQQGVIDGQAQSTFKDSLMKKVTAQVPAGYILYPAASQFSYQTDPTWSSSTPDAKVPISGTVSAVIIKKSDLDLALIKRLLPQSTDTEISEIQLEDTENLTYAFSQVNQVIDKNTQLIGFTLSGSLHAHWNPDLGSLKNSLTGISSTVVTSVFQADPGITNAQVHIFPPWQSHLPTDPTKIHIEVH